jgi:hypothetical protein
MDFSSIGFTPMSCSKAVAAPHTWSVIVPDTAPRRAILAPTPTIPGTSATPGGLGAGSGVCSTPSRVVAKVTVALVDDGARLDNDICADFRAGSETCAILVVDKVVEILRSGEAAAMEVSDVLMGWLSSSIIAFAARSPITSCDPES